MLLIGIQAVVAPRDAIQFFYLIDAMENLTRWHRFQVGENFLGNARDAMNVTLSPVAHTDCR